VRTVDRQCRIAAMRFLAAYEMTDEARHDEVDRLAQQLQQVAEDYVENLGVEKR